MGRQAEGLCPTWGSRGRPSAWPAALLAAAILSSRFLLTQAQDISVKVEVEPSLPLKGQDVTLTPGGNLSFVLCNWYRGERADRNLILTYIPAYPSQQNGPLFTGRETGGPNCSLRIRSLVLNDTGIYAVSKTLPLGREVASVHLEVFEKLFPPTLWPADSFVKEHTNVTLNCTTSESASVFWFKDGEAVPAKSILSKRNRTLNIPDISRDDEGKYTCQAWNPANNAMSNSSKIAVDAPPPDPNHGLSAGAIVGIVIGCLVGVVIIVTVLYFALKSTSFGRMEQHSSNGNIPSAPGHNQGVTDTKPTAGEEDIQYTTLAFNSNRPPQPSLGPNIPLETGTIYSVIKNK